MSRINPVELKRTKDAFFDVGISVAEWAHANNFNLQLVYRVLNGTCKASRGESHKIAVALGLKHSAAVNSKVEPLISANSKGA